jgi:hypothetical protein
VLGLVFVNVPEVLRLFVRLTADFQALQARYPIHSVVKDRAFHFGKPGPKALETRKPVDYYWQNCFQLEATFDGIELETANENLVELTGIEPVTSCLQSTRSPN